MNRVIKTLICAFLLMAFAASPVSAVKGLDSVDNLRFSIEVNGDVNGDGRISSLDAALILRYDADLLDEFENKAEAPELTAEIEERVTSGYYEYSNTTTDEVQLEILGYYGTYNGWDAVLVYQRGLEYRPGGRYITEIEDYWFIEDYGVDLFICKESEFYGIKEAYEKDLITKDDVLEIGLLYGILLAEDDIGKDPYDCFPQVKRHYGDVNGDGRINSLDAALVLRYDADLLDAE